MVEDRKRPSPSEAYSPGYCPVHRLCRKRLACTTPGHAKCAESAHKQQAGRWHRNQCNVGKGHSQMSRPASSGALKVCVSAIAKSLLITSSAPGSASPLPKMKRVTPDDPPITSPLTKNSAVSMRKSPRSLWPRQMTE